MSSSAANGSDPKQRISEEEYGPNSDPVSYQRYPTKIANPGPMGLFSFAATTFVLSMYNLHARGVQAPNVVIGMAIFGGGLTQFIAGMWEMPRGNVFGATAFASYGSFWLAYATINIPASGIQAAFADQTEFHNALGIFLITWFMITFFFLHIAFTILLTLLDVALLMLSISEFTGNAMVLKAGGVFGVCTGLVAFYIGVSELFAAEPKPVLNRVPLGVLHKV
ncbi:hypothetical protein L218DRAFT_951237 [Marasmius fiardii PR-910]|nr:hypothetical protein L218DRAFT_951237 [Marasmius fiardii PR-910]